LEHACMCREGSLSHYDANGEPVRLPNQRDDAQLAQMEVLQDGILAGAGAINRLLGDLTATPHHVSGLAAQVGRMVEAMLLYPSREEVDTVGLWQHEANFDLTDRRRLVDLGFDPGLLEYRGFAALAEVGRQNVYWPAAAFARTNPFIAAAYAAG